MIKLLGKYLLIISLALNGHNIENLLLNSIKDNKKFDIKAVELLYSLPINAFTLINDEMSNIYLAKIKNFQNEKIENIDEKRLYFISNTLNQINADLIRNKLLLKVLPLKV